MVHQSIQIIRDEHTTLAAMLRSFGMMVERGCGDAPENYFDVMRAMLFYIDEFPERLHHPKESELLFPPGCPAGARDPGADCPAGQRPCQWRIGGTRTAASVAGLGAAG